MLFARARLPLPVRRATAVGKVSGGVDMRWHWQYAAWAAVVLIVEIVIALFVDDRLIRPLGGDALAVVLVYLAIRAVTRWRVATALSLACAIAVAVEFSQLFGLVDMLGLGGNRVARTVLGTGFDRRDFVAYALGAGAAAAIERMRSRRRG